MAAIVEGEIDRHVISGEGPEGEMPLDHEPAQCSPTPKSPQDDETGKEPDNGEEDIYPEDERQCHQDEEEG